jgi:hypothetical protein
MVPFRVARARAILPPEPSRNPEDGMRTHRCFWALAPMLLLASCADYSTPDEVINGAVVVTQQNTTFDYAAQTSYYLDPIASVVKDDPQNTETLDLRTAPYNQILTAIDNNMAAAGFATKLDALPPAGTADTVGLHITLLQGTVSVYYPGYWCDYWYYYSCYYNWSYAGSYNTGMMILEMSDLSSTSTTLPVAWLAGVYGVAGSATYNTTLAVQGVNRAFGQSPYLNH